MDAHKLVDLALRRDLSDWGAASDAFEAVRLLEIEDFSAAHKANKILRSITARYAAQTGSPDFFLLNKKTLLFDAPYDFDAHCRYIEWNRDPDKRFYLPRRSRLLPVAAQLQKLADGKLKLLAISLPPGVGKALANDTPVLTRAGWKNHGDLVVGDEVIGLNGEFKKVVAVHPKCRLDVLVEFTNGEAIQCHENHEWLVHDRGRHTDCDYIAETKRLEKRKYESGGPRGKRGHRYILQLPLNGAIIGEHKNLPVDPYLLGAWLGDGANRNPRIANAPEDKAIISRIVEQGTPIRWSTQHKTTGVWYYDFDIRSELQKFGMCHSRKTSPKHIPEEYLTADLEQRLLLLAGLLDTDGCLCGGKKYQFSTCEKSLRDTFVELLSTFGWRPCVVSRSPRVSSSGVSGRSTVYVISFTPDREVPCALLRKRNTPVPRNRTAIKAIRRVAPKEGNCITVEGDGMYLAGRRMVPTHNTTLAIFFLTWLAGKNPDKPILGGSHSNSFLRGVYDECLRIMDPHGEYLWGDVFPGVGVTSTNAQDMKIDLGYPKRFTTLEFSSIGSGNAGKVRAEQLLYCDDLVDGIEAALSRERMDKLWNLYATDLRQRKIGDCHELHIATRWSVHDVIGRLEDMYGDDPEAEFIRIPALNEKDESNFDYGNHAGFTTQFYHEQREAMDDASWRALYMNEPIEREGQLYADGELRKYFELPDREPDAVLAVCDTKTTGSDYAFLPIMYQYGQDYYLEACICDNGKEENVEDRIVDALLRHKVQMARFESNSAGGTIARNVQKAVKSKNGRCHITTKYTTDNKQTKIIVNSPWVKEHVLFNEEKSKKDKEYRRMYQFLTGYTMAGKNKHDDVPDGLACFAIYAQELLGGTVNVWQRKF